MFGGTMRKFGLIGSASQRKQAENVPTKKGPRAPPKGAVGSAFGADSDDDREDPTSRRAVNKRLVALSVKKEAEEKKLHEAAQQANPDIYDYDGVYDEIQQGRNDRQKAQAAVKADPGKRQPKYIGNLLQMAKVREVEADRAYERKLQKEREEQDKMVGEAEMKFITSAYKQKLMEQKKWELQQSLEEQRENKRDVTKLGMGGFYQNLLTKNIAMGGDVSSATSAFTAGSKRQEQTMAYKMKQDVSKLSQQGGDAAPPTVSTDASAAMRDPRAAPRRGREEHAEGVSTEEEPSQSKRGASRRDQDQTQPAAPGQPQSPEAQHGQNEASDQSPSARPGEPQSHEEHPGRKAKSHRRSDSPPGSPTWEGSPKRRRTKAEEALGGGGPEAAVDPAVAAAEAKAKREAEIKAARDRFMARRQGVGNPGPA